MRTRNMGVMAIGLLLGACALGTENGPSGTSTSSAALEGGIELGDANGDGTINVVDSLAVAQYAEGQSPQPFYPEAADADCDGTIDTDDSALISQFAIGNVPSLVCPAYQGLVTFDPWYEDIAEFETFTSEHFTLYSAEAVDQAQVAHFFANLEACHALQAQATPEWVNRVEHQSALDWDSKTVGFVHETCGAGCGNQYRVEVPSWIFSQLSELGSRENSWIFYYEMQRQGGTAYSWYSYLFYEPAGTDWNSAFAHSMAITCSEAIGTGAHHGNVDFVNSALPEWVGLTLQQSWVDLLAGGQGGFVRNDGQSQGINDLFGAMLAELYRRHGVEFFHQLTQELQSGAYSTVESARTQACNFLQATDAVTGGGSHNMMVNEWRLPADCDGGGQDVTAALTVTSRWNGGYCVQVDVANASTQPTSSWTASIAAPSSTVYTSWSANFSASSGIVTAQSLSWNGVIAPSAATGFGFCANTPAGSSVTPTVTSVTAQF